jgi:hypothetical protein
MHGDNIEDGIAQAFYVQSLPLDLQACGAWGVFLNSRSLRGSGSRSWCMPMNPILKHSAEAMKFFRRYSFKGLHFKYCSSNGVRQRFFSATVKYVFL